VMPLSGRPNGADRVVVSDAADMGGGSSAVSPNFAQAPPLGARRALAYWRRFVRGA
jgi:hypothetical protein